MKKFIRFGIPMLMITALFFSSFGLVEAKTIEGSKTKVSSKTEKARCMKLDSKKQKAKCLQKINKANKKSKGKTIETDSSHGGGTTGTTGDRINPIPDYFISYIDRVIPNLDSVYENRTRFAHEIEDMLEELSDDGVDVSISEDLLAEARENLRMAKEFTDEARANYVRERREGGRTWSQIVWNDNGISLVTSEEAYNQCLENGGTLMTIDSRRCVLGTVVYINPTPIEEVALLMYGIRTNGTPFTDTFENIDQAREYLKSALRKLNQANNSIDPGLRRSSGSNTTSTNPTSVPEVAEIATEEN